MKTLADLLWYPILLMLWMFITSSNSTSRPFMIQSLSNSSFPSNYLGDWNDPRFVMHAEYGATDLPVTPIFMNAVELMAQFAGLDFTARIRRRRGVVLPAYPQVEIAVIPAPPATTVEVRLIIWGIYGIVLDMVQKNKFREYEAEVFWIDQFMAYIYFTKPMDTLLNINNVSQISDQLDIPNITSVTATTSMDSIPNNTNIAADTDHFDWNPSFKPAGKNLFPKDIFLLTMGVIRTIAPNAATEMVDGAFFVSSEIVDVNMQVYLHRRRAPRTQPPFLQYGHVVEAARRIPGWMLEQKRWAEFFCAIDISHRPVGNLVVGKGPYTPGVQKVGSAI